MSSLKEYLATGTKDVEATVMDGATGTLLGDYGYQASEQWNGGCAPRELVTRVHTAYLEAGATVLTTNTYCLNRHVMGLPGPPRSCSTVADANAEAIEVARAAIAAFGESQDGEGKANNVVLLGSVSNHPPAVASSNEAPEDGNFTAMGVWPSPDVEAENYVEQIEALVEGGVDALVLEMMKERSHAGAAIGAAVASGLPVIIGLTIAIGDDGQVVARDDHSLSLSEMLAMWAGLPHVVGIAIMHSDLSDTKVAVRALAAAYDGLILAYPNQGVWAPPNWTVLEDISPEDYADWAVEVYHAGARVIGGCCGFRPAHITALAHRCAEMMVYPSDVVTVVSGAAASSPAASSPEPTPEPAPEPAPEADPSDL